MFCQRLWKMCYSYRCVLKITIHVFHFDPFNDTCADDETFTTISDNLTVRNVPWNCPLNVFFIFLEETFVLWVLVYYNLWFFLFNKVLDLHIAVDYSKSLSQHSDSSFSTKNLLFSSIVCVMH